MTERVARAAAAPAPPSGIAGAVAVVRSLLVESGFDVRAVRAALQVETELMSTPADATVHDRRLDGVPPALAALIRLFVLDFPIDAGEAERVLTSPGLESLQKVGLVDEKCGLVEAQARVVPHDDLLVASDRVRDSAPDHVAAVHRPSATLANLTVRRPVKSTLDVGTGNGIQALLAAPHSGRVVATDISERAVAFAEFNAALNGMTNIEVRAGSFFEPVRGERFDLVVCNPPYVISPESEHIFRDSGLPGDSVSEQIVGALPSHLADGGFATALLSWIAGDDPTERPRRWIEAAGCNGWLIHTDTQDPLTAAAAWNRDEARTPERLDSWVAYYEGLGIGAVAYGAAIVQHAAGAPWIHEAELPPNRLWPASDHIQRLFAAHELLTGDVLARPLTLVPDAHVDRTVQLEHGRWEHTGANVRLESGIGFGVTLDRYGVAVVGELDGKAPIRARLGELAAHVGMPEDALATFADHLVRHLVERGFAVAA